MASKNYEAFLTNQTLLRASGNDPDLIRETLDSYPALERVTVNVLLADVMARRAAIRDAQEAATTPPARPALR